MTLALPAPRLWTPHIWVPRVRGLSLREYLAWMTSRRMLLEVPGGPYRPRVPTIVSGQTVTNRNQTSCTFASNTTVGNLLLYLVTKRAAATVPPNDGGSWTVIGTGQFQATGSTTENGFAAYARVVTAAQTFYSTGPSPTTAVMHEIANTSLVGITPFVVSDHGSGTAIDLGSAGVLDATRLMFILAGNGADGVAETVTPGVWIRDWFADRDIDSLGTNTISGAGAMPQTWYGHTRGAGAAVQARIDLSVTQKYGGIAVLLA